MSDQPEKPASPVEAQKRLQAERLAAQLRANLKRRKQAGQSGAAAEPDAPGTASAAPKGGKSDT